eukprot:1157797-Pelagomonas_calceolata.AAC.6
MAFLLVFISLLLGVLAFFHMIKHPGQKQGSSMSMRVRCSHAQRQAANLRPSLSGAVQHASERPDTISKAMEKGAIQSPPPLRIVIMVRCVGNKRGCLGERDCDHMCRPAIS